MNATQTKTLNAIFANPVNGNIEWSKIESLLIAVGCRVIETKKGVAFEKDGAKEYFHRPHPGKEALRYRVSAARSFLIRIGVRPETKKS
jgi:hypothetical protein